MPFTHVTVVTMGPPQAKDLLLECLAMGADEGVLVSDRAVGGSDTWATSYALAQGIKAEQSVGDFSSHVFHSFFHTLAVVAFFVAVAQFKGFAAAGGGA